LICLSSSILLREVFIGFTEFSEFSTFQFCVAHTKAILFFRFLNAIFSMVVSVACPLERQSVGGKMSKPVITPPAGGALLPGVIACDEAPTEQQISQSDMELPTVRFGASWDSPLRVIRRFVGFAASSDSPLRRIRHFVGFAAL